MNIKIRKATIKDLEKILTLNKNLFEFERQFGDTYNLNWTFSNEGKRIFSKRINQGESISLVAEIEEKVVGYLVSYIDTYLFRSSNPIITLENMYVDEKYRNQGVGTKLAKEMENLAREKGVKRIKVGAIAQNEKTINFYRSLGFLDFELILEKSI